MHIQESGEMYLESIYVLSQRLSCVRAIDVGEYLGYSKPSVSRAMGLLKKDKQLFIFPEGTRNKTGTNEIQEIKSGFLIFASKGETSITPMFMYRKPKAFRKKYIIVGKPFELVGENPKRLTKEELEENFERYLQVLNELRDELNNYVDSKKRKNKKIRKSAQALPLSRLFPSLKVLEGV